jgi:hypothetical protein
MTQIVLSLLFLLCQSMVLGGAAQSAASPES